MAVAPQGCPDGRCLVSWDPLQREVIEALGYTLYSAQGPVQAMAGEDSRINGPESVEAPPSASQAAGADSVLLRALLRAAGTGASAPDARALCQRWIATSAADANARRALWPQLRSLRGRRLS